MGATPLDRIEYAMAVVMLGTTKQEINDILRGVRDAQVLTWVEKK